MSPRDRLVLLLQDATSGVQSCRGPGDALVRFTRGERCETFPPLEGKRPIDRAIEAYTRRLLAPSPRTPGEGWGEGHLSANERFSPPPLPSPGVLGEGIELPASVGATVACAAWSGNVPRIMRTQTERGPFLVSTADDNPELVWFHELAILHAVTSEAMRTNDARLLAASRRAADFHLAETQPDHATNLPWAIHAFAFSADHLPLAEGMLHAWRMHDPLAQNQTALLLLADALHSLRAWHP